MSHSHCCRSEIESNASPHRPAVRMVKTTHADSMLPFLLQAHVKEAWQELDSPPKAVAVGPHCVLQPVKAARVMRFAEAMQIIQKNAPVSV